MRYRVEDLAARCDVSVDTIRFYQSRGLIPPPEREGRIAWYGEWHVERLLRIRELKAQGFSLALIGRVLSGELDAAEEALALAISGPLPHDAVGGSALTVTELAERTGVSPTLLEALAREGLLTPGGTEEEPRYSPADAEAVRAGLALLGAGVPLSELLDLARRHDEAMRETAEHAVDLFARFVRDPVRASAASDTEAATRSVEALQAMLPASTSLVAHHFQRQLLAAARARLEAAPELDADGEATPELDADGEAERGDGSGGGGDGGGDGGGRRGAEG